MNKNLAGAIVVLIIILIGGWYLMKGTPANAPAPITAGEETSLPPAETIPAVTIVYSDKGFTPKGITVPVGTTVTFVNQSKGGMWVGSSKHPSHTVYSGTSVEEHCPDTSGTAFDQCSAATTGGTYSFTFAKIGTWAYHNHVNASDFGSVTVIAAATTTP